MSPGTAATVAARILVRHLSLLACQSRIQNPESAAQAPVLHQLGRTYYVSVGFYPARDYQPLVEFGAIRRGGSKSILLTDEHIDTLADSLPKMLISICYWGTGTAPAVGCESRTFRLSPPNNFGSARLYFGKQYIRLLILELQYLARKFHIVQQQLLNYTLALPDVLSYLASYAELVPNASDYIDYRHLFEELATAT